MILKPIDLKRMIDAWLDKGHSVNLDLQTGKLSVHPGPDRQQLSSSDAFDLLDLKRKT